MKPIAAATVFAALGSVVLLGPQAHAAGNVYSNQSFTFASFAATSPLTFSYNAGTKTYTGTSDVTFSFLKPGGGFTKYDATLSVNFLATKSGASKVGTNLAQAFIGSKSTLKLALKHADSQGHKNLLTVGMSPILSGVSGGKTAVASGNTSKPGQTVNFSSDFFVTPAKNVNNTKAVEQYSLSLSNMLGSWGKVADNYFNSKYRLADFTADWSGSFGSSNVSLKNLPAGVTPTPEAGSIASLAMLIPGGLFLMRRRRKDSLAAA